MVVQRGGAADGRAALRCARPAVGARYADAAADPRTALARASHPGRAGARRVDVPRLRARRCAVQSARTLRSVTPLAPSLDTATHHSNEPDRQHGQSSAGSARPLEARTGGADKRACAGAPRGAPRPRRAAGRPHGRARASGSVKNRAPRSDAARASAARRASSRPSRASASRATASAVTTCPRRAGLG